MRIIVIISAVFLGACNEPKTLDSNTNIALSDQHTITLLASEDAQAFIIKDNKEHFFKKINTLDISLQLKGQSLPSDRKEVIKTYQAALQNSVQDFNDFELKQLEEVFKNTFQFINVISPDIFPKQVYLIKIDGQHYGEGVYYTREDAIVIPMQQLDHNSTGSLVDVMIHEIFHIYTRYNDSKRKRLYKAIGFEATSISRIPELLAKKRLINPDGVNQAFSIELYRGDSSFSAVPIIYANETTYQAEKPSYFQYINFELFEIEDNGEILANVEGNSTIDITAHPEFKAQIGTNTDYIIHPDEILAENFVLLVLSKQDPKFLKGTPIQSKILLNKMEVILK